MLEAVSYMTEESIVAISVTKVFTMPEEMPIKRVLPHRLVIVCHACHTGQRFDRHCHTLLISGCFGRLASG